MKPQANVDDADNIDARKKDAMQIILMQMQ